MTRQTKIDKPLTGLSKENAIEAVESAGLNICVKGNDSDAEKAVALNDQSIEAGKQVPEGTIVSVTITAVDALHE